MKKISLLFLIFVLVFTGCQSPTSTSTSSTPSSPPPVSVTASDVLTGYGAISNGAAAAMGTTPVTTTVGTIMTRTYTGSNVVVVMTIDLTTYNFTEQFTFTNCTSSPYTINGTINWTGSFNPTTQLPANMTQTADLTLTGGVVTTLTCDLNINYNSSGSPSSYSGTITANGQVFTTAQLGLPS